MTRIPLRPLARILDARRRGQNPDAIERENRRLRHEHLRDQQRRVAESRLVVLSLLFVAGFLTIGARMAVLASTEPSEPASVAASASIAAQRADILDRKGRILATNLATNALYAQPPIMVDPDGAARALARIFPDLDAQTLAKRFKSGRKFIWIRKKLSPEQQQAVHDIGEPGLLFAPREMRLYPNGRLAAHVLGGTGFGREGVHAAELVGRAGVEKAFDGFLRDPANGGRPLQLSIDLSIQSTVRRVLDGGMRLLNARGAAAVVMDARTGEIVALASLPDFDPNDRPAPPTGGDPADSPLFNRAVQGVYELGSTFKTFTIAQALELGLVTPATEIDTKGPLRWGRFRIRDFHDLGPKLSVTDVLVKSSNIGTARIAQLIGAERQKSFLRQLGLLDPAPVELAEAPSAHPLYPSNWSEISTMTISYGHGLSTSPLHLAAAYATIVNGGHKVRPTLVLGGGRRDGERLISAETSRQLRKMLAEVVTRGTATFAQVPGYPIGGKTGTADKPNPKGGYYKDKVIATFAGAFPASDPKYVVVVTLDEPVETSGPKPRRTAGWTAVPVAAEIVRRIAPLLGVRPVIEQGGAPALTLTGN
ncbi:MAG: penicillin-binding protein 2 [Alphaproteobacteria bacterium]|nr:MAG: penicillin-binding protein 2 [Alphaproteobacteria bacterium]